MYYRLPVKKEMERKKRTLLVYGEGTVTAQPDQAKLTLGVSTTNENVQSAQQENAVRMNQVITSIVNLGVPRDDIQTSQYRITPQYDYVDGKRIFRGYEVVNLVEVTINDLTMVGTILDTAVQHGANQIGNIQFLVSQPEQYYQQALIQSVHQSFKKARAIVSAIRVTLDETPISITELTEDRPLTLVKAATYDTYEEITPISPGTLDITAKVKSEFKYY
jgi:uncharacterized protein